ncbi:MAG: hypothetical protein EOP54_16490 [Sphingobacteriales bacterium]|nr:MAG: hypothetical protein EOP54_16490 [Sphingobacteriales bacterium]
MSLTSLKLSVKQNTRAANVIRQALYSIFLKGASLLIAFLYVPLLLNYLDSEKYGIWLTVLTITNWVSVFDVGLGNGLRNKLGTALATGDKELSRIYISTTYALVGMLTLAFLLLFNLLNYYIPWNKVLNTSFVSVEELYLLTSIAISVTILRFFVQLVGVIFIAHQMSSKNDLILTLSSMISLLTVFIISKVLPPGNILVLSLAITLVPVLLYVLFSLLAFSDRFKDIRPSARYVRIGYSRALLSLSGRFFIVQVTALVVYASANVVVANLFGPKEVIVYNTAFTIFNATIMMMALCLSPVWSSVTDAYALKDFTYLKKTLRRLNYLALLLSAGVLLLLGISNFIFDIWLKGKVIIPFMLSSSMAFYAIIYMFQAPYSIFINGMGKMKITSRLAIISIAVYLAAAIVLSKLLNSSAGVILAIALCGLISLVIERIQVKKLLNNTATGIWNK